MKFRLHSDLHLDFSDYTLPTTDDEQNTILLLAGDICEAQRKSKYVPFFEDVCARFKLVVYVFGNHEHYGDSISRSHVHFLRNVDHDNLYLLDNEDLDLGKVVIFGSTLWTSFKNADPMIMHEAKYRMNDYNQIRTGPPGMPYQKTLHPNDIFNENKVAKKYLFDGQAKAEAEGKKTVFVTHMAPTWASVPQKFSADILSYCYANEYHDDLLDNCGPNLWVHGHIHTFCEYDMGRTKVVCNPRGYEVIPSGPYEKYYSEETGHKPIVIDLDEETGLATIIK